MSSVLETETVKEKMPCGKSIYVTLARNPNDGHVNKVLITTGKSGTCHRALFEALQNMVNIALEKNGNSTDEIFYSLRGIRCEYPKMGVAFSCIDFLAKIIGDGVTRYDSM